jgi:hypothetical protein
MNNKIILNKELRGRNKQDKASQSLLDKPDELLKRKHVIIQKELDLIQINQNLIEQTVNQEREEFIVQT